MKRTPLRRLTPLRRSTPLESGGPLERGAPLKRLTPLKPGRRSRGVASTLREEVARRDGGCRGRALLPDVPCWGRLDPHHVLRRSQGGLDEASNLVTLCRSHHDWVHAHPAESKRLGLLRTPTTEEPK